MQDGPHKNAIRRGLLRWYDQHQRDLPWRPTKARPANPYHVLVSEAMLQQTQVATVIDFFSRFITALPTLKSLAAADEQQVLRLWQGLGYYRRARHLHAAAKVIVHEHDGQVPHDVVTLQKLPGVGRYTAGAIASIAHNRPAPIVDGNVARVLARVFCMDEPIDTTPMRRCLWELAGELVSPSRPGDFNQAMMELGAIVCTPRQPTCLTCPLKKVCTAYHEGKVDQLPIIAKRTQPKDVTHTVIAVHRNGRYLFEQRGSKGLWSNMWQLPTSEEAIDPALWISERFGLFIAKPTKLESFTHQTTHRTIRFQVFHAHTQSGRLRRGSGQWRSLAKLDDLPLPNPQRRAVKMLKNIT